MLSSVEKHRLIQDYRHTPAGIAAVALKCTAGLVAIAGLALIGAMTDMEEGTVGESAQAQHVRSAALAHAQQVLAERRARFESEQGQRREMVGASFFGGVAEAATSEPKIDEVALLRHASD